MADRQLFSAVEAAYILGLTYRTVLYMIKHGKIHAVKIGKHWRVSLDELDRLRKEGT